nr:hypothetical protein Itr_chr04CG10030 [Ipomoea trifida]
MSDWVTSFPSSSHLSKTLLTDSGDAARTTSRISEEAFAFVWLAGLSVSEPSSLCGPSVSSSNNSDSETNSSPLFKFPSSTEPEVIGDSSSENPSNSSSSSPLLFVPAHEEKLWLPLNGVDGLQAILLNLLTDRDESDTNASALLTPLS